MWKVLWWFCELQKRGLVSGVTFWNCKVHAMVILPPCFLTSSTICFYYFSLLLLVVLSAHSESPHHIKPLDSLDPTSATVCPTSSSAQLGVLAPQNEVFKIVTVNCPLSNRVKTIIKFVLNLGAKSFKILTSTLIHGGENFAWKSEFCWNLFSMFWRCIPGLCLRIKLPFSLDADLLDYC